MGSNPVLAGPVSPSAGSAATAAVTGTAAPGSGTGAGRRTGPAPKARADAARNRARIIAAAREAFVLHGADAHLDDIARRAGVGNATLYRHFPSRHALVRGVMLAVTERVADRAQAALGELDAARAESKAGNGSGGSGGELDANGEASASAADDGAASPDAAADDVDAGAFAALRHFALGAEVEQIGALCPMINEDFDREDPELLAAKRRLDDLLAELIERGRRSGQVREDIGPGDVMLALSQLTRPLPGTGCAAIADFADRQVRLYLDGLRASARSELPGHTATLEELRARSQRGTAPAGPTGSRA
jgi:AcrR family transcriptional regulator